MSIKLTDKIESVAKAGVIVDAIQVSGGYIVVNTSLDEIKQQSIKIGTKAYITSEDKEYRYTTNGWKMCINTTSDVGTKTYISIEAASADLPNLTQGQLITVVDEQSAYAYIVGYNNEKLFDVAASNTPQNEISTTSIDSIIDGTYQSNNVTSNISTQTSTIDAILNNEYIGEATDEEKLIIDTIINGTYEEV